MENVAAFVATLVPSDLYWDSARISARLLRAPVLGLALTIAKAFNAGRALWLYYGHVGVVPARGSIGPIGDLSCWARGRRAKVKA